MKIYNKIILFTASILSFVSCESFLDIDAPSSQLNSSNVFEEKATATAAMTDIYGKMRDAGMLTGTSSGLTSLLGIYTDELDFYGSSETAGYLFYTNSLIPSNSTVKALWNSSYNQIYSANLVIHGVQNSVNLSQTDRDQLKGEALFVRALLHFYLANLYGDVPYLKSTDYLNNTQVARMPVSDVYSLCQEDLLEAINLLPNNYISGTRTRPNKFTAYALLARVALYAGENTIAREAASNVLNNTTLYQLEGNLDVMFIKTSRSTIWQFDPGASNQNTYEGSTFIFQTGPPPVSALKQNLVDAFLPGDQRRAHWIKEITNGQSIWYHPYKYKIQNSTTPTEFPIVLRLSEIYLIRAEARAKLGDFAGAKEDLNIIRQNAGIGNTSAMTQSEILDDIFLQRRLELFTEFGHRFFDLKRLGQFEPLISLKPGWDAHDSLLPIPESELLLNPALLPQNPGY